MSAELAPVPAQTPLAVREHTRPSGASVVLYFLARAFLKPVFRIFPLGAGGLRTLTLIEWFFTRLPHPKAVDHEDTDLGGVSAEVSVPRHDADDQLAGATVLYLHGGAFLFCGPASHRHVCSRLADTLAVPVYSVRYRQLPECGVGASVQDAYDAYRALLETCPDPHRVVLAGDSAGGFLAAKICELAALDSVTPPVAFVGYSPQLSLDIDRRDHALLRNDAFMPLSAVIRAKPLWTRGPVALRGTRSPVDTPAESFPPTFLTAAARELLEPDIRALADSLHRAGRTVEAHVFRRQVHAFPVLDALLPESREAMRLTGAFLRRVLA